MNEKDGNKPFCETEEDTPQVVIAAYEAAVKSSYSRPGAGFEAAVGAYRSRHPNTALQVVRRRVAEIICFAGTRPFLVLDDAARCKRYLNGRHLGWVRRNSG